MLDRSVSRAIVQKITALLDVDWRGGLTLGIVYPADQPDIERDAQWQRL
jgi:hypothetical protein